MTTSQTWTTEQDDYLRQHYATTPTADLAEVLGRTYGAVSERASRRLGLHKDKATLQESTRRATLARSIWTATLDEILALMYPHCASQLIAELLGIKATVINARADRKGLKKTKQHLRDAQYQRMANNPEPYLAARLKPGNVPWHKGTKGLQIGGKDTQFRKGNTPQTSVPVGSESWTAPGRRRLKKVSYLRRKVAEPNVWKFVHIIVWEEANGPVPPGHIVRFVDGNTKNIVLSNLVCITRSENSRRNSPWTTMPRELAEVVNMRGQLVRQINKAKRRSAAADTTAPKTTTKTTNTTQHQPESCPA